VKYGLTTNTLGERGYGGLRPLSPRPQRFAQSSAKQTKQSDKQSVPAVNSENSGPFESFLRGLGITRVCGRNHHLHERVELAVVQHSFDPFFIVTGVHRKKWGQK
jgi:hypothetical protein